MTKFLKVSGGIFVVLLFICYILQVYDIKIITNLPYTDEASNITQFFDAPKREHILIYSTIYYNVSKLYSSNSMIIILNAYKNIETQNSILECYSKNDTNTLFSKLQIRLAHNEPAKNCQWEVFIANCSTVSNPIFFGLTTNESERNVIELKFDAPVSEKYPTVMCYTPLFYESRWQQLIFATEIYHHFGIDFQIQYINSAMKQIMEILMIYEKKKWIKIQEFAYYDFDKETIKEIGYHPSKETVFRNQLTAQADCVMRYRESSEFIISADIDDVLFPKEKDYYTEFLKWKRVYPNAAGFVYPRRYAKINKPNEFQNFSLSTVIESLTLSNASYLGKPVLRTDKVETPWIYSFGLSNGEPVYLNLKDATMAHVQISAKKIQTVATFSRLDENENLTSFNPISSHERNALNQNFLSSFKNITNFISNFVYADIIFDCFKESELFDQDYCYTQFRCKIPNNITNFECETARRSISSVTLNNNLIFHIPQSEFRWLKSKDNCKIFD